MKRGLLLCAVVCGCVHPPGPVDDSPDAGDTPDAGSACTGAPGSFQTLGTWKDASHAILYADGKIFASDSAQDRVVVFDADAGTMLGEVHTGRVPLYLTAGGGHVFTVNSLATATPDTLSTVIDTQTLSAVAGVPIPTLNGEDANFPGDLGFYDGVLYITNFTFSTPMMFPVDLSTYRTQTGIPAGSGPGPVVGSAGKLFLASLGVIFSDLDDKITVMDKAGTVLTTLPTGGKLQRMVTGPDGRVFVVRSSKTAGMSRLLAIDPNTYQYTEIPLGDLPYGISLLGDLLYVMNMGGTGFAGPSITVIDTAHGDATRTIDLSTLSPVPVNPRGIAAAPCGRIFIEADQLIGLYQDQF